jgi:3-hydroxyacyl-[acyl-carrier-protein] dehydratase
MTGATEVLGPLTPEQVLEMLPQQEPFRFVDRILELDEDHIVATYRFRPEADFYRGHFPGDPVTPGVILLEALGQAGVVALGIYLFALDHSREEAERTVSLFADAEVEFYRMVPPDTEVTITATKVFWRRNKIRSRATMAFADGTLICEGTISGMGVNR